MVRPPLTRSELERGGRLGALLRRARGDRSMAAVAAAAGVSAETLRKIETGRAPTPSFFTVAAIAAVLGLRLDELALSALAAASVAADASDAAGRDGTPIPVAA